VERVGAGAVVLDGFPVSVVGVDGAPLWFDSPSCKSIQRIFLHFAVWWNREAILLQKFLCGCRLLGKYQSPDSLIKA